MNRVGVQSPSELATLLTTYPQPKGTTMRPPRKQLTGDVDLYVRKSKVLAHGDRLREVSTQEQERIGREWAESEGLRVRKVWTELGSAYHERERPQFNAALDAVLSGEVPTLWVYMLDRFSRRGAEDVLKVLGKARVIFWWDQLDSMNERDRERIITEAERARSYSVRLSARIRDSKQGTRDRGEWLGGPAPWGLIVDPKTMKVFPDHETTVEDGSGRTRADVVAWITDELAKNTSARWIVGELNRLGIKSPRGGIWHTQTLISLATNPAIAGLQTGGRTVPGRLDPYRNDRGELVSLGEGIITPELRETIIANLAKSENRFNTTHRITRGSRHRKHVLSGIVHCSGCGRAAPASGKQHVCSSLATAAKACPAPVMMRREIAEKYVIDQWVHRISALEPTDTLALIIAERWTARQKPRETAELAEKRRILAERETVRQRLHRAYRAGAYEGAEELFVSEMRDVSAEIRDLREQLAAADTTLDLGFVDDPETLRDAMTNALAEGNRALVGDLLRLAIDRIDLDKARRRGRYAWREDRIHITWADAGAPAE